MIRARVAAVLALLLGAGAAHGEESPAPRPGDTIAWHVVRQGETWETITQSYLGTARLWAENWRLNPALKDPNYLAPGQRVRVIVDRALPPREAALRAVERRVDRKPEPQAWTPARVGDTLKERDGIHTFESSSADLLFDDGSHVLVTEESIVFLRELRATLTGRGRESIEVVDGQADLRSQPRREGRPEIEIVVAGARARPRGTGTAGAEARARRAGEAAQFMVYGGTSQLESGGASVTVPRGMGTTAQAGRPPGPLERLLPAPTGLASECACPLPTLAWRPVAGAKSYSLEVCRDPGCAQLLERATGVSGLSWRARTALPPGRYYFRATAVSASGLDGFPAAGVPLDVPWGDLDREPPVVVVLLEGEGSASAPDVLTLRGEGGLRLEAHDDASGVAEVRYRWDAGSWQLWSGTRLGPQPGSHVLEFAATDNAGKLSPTWRVSVVAEPPSR